MKQKLFTLLLAVAASVGTLFASTKIGDLYYNLDATNQTAEVAENSSASGDITIPSSVTYNSVSYSVTSIGSRAFYGCSSLTSVTIPNSVTGIEGNAFYNCTGLTSVNITDIAAWCNITFSIWDSNPLYYAKHLYVNNVEVTNLTIPNSITSIGKYAFYQCSSLTSVTIPNSVTSIGDRAFYGCTGLTSVTIPNSVTSIEGYAFDNCTGLTSVTIGNSVTSIGNGAFYNCSGLRSVTIPNSVTSIGSHAFNNCSSLTSIIVENGNSFYDSRNNCNAIIETATNTLIVGCKNTIIPNSVTIIGESAFYGCGYIGNLVIGENVTTIARLAFDQCSIDTLFYNAIRHITLESSSEGGLYRSEINTIILGDKVEFIPAGIYGKRTNITDVVLPNSVVEIGPKAFYGCSLQSITISENVSVIGLEAFGECINLTSVTIPNSVTSIGDRAFYGCTGLTSVIWNAKNYADFVSNNTPFYADYYWDDKKPHVIDLRPQITSFTFGNEVEHIPAYLCSGMSNLTSVTIEAETPPTLGSNAFNNTSNCPIYVPCNAASAYKSAWPGYANRIKYAPLPYKISTQAENGSVTTTDVTTLTICDEPFITCTATPDYGYHFTQWSDGSTDNPRMIELTQDTTITAEFAKNTYTISAESANPEWGATAGDTTALYLDEVAISATANYGYHFVRWNDYNTSNPRVVSVTGDKTYTATFAKNVYYITKNAEHGTISGNNTAEYLDFVTLTVTPDYGYHFTQWSDGLKDNPRIFQITQDTTFTAEFAYERVGTCGKDMALVWSYDPNAKVLTIGNAGSFTENMQFGVEAPTEMEELVIGNSVTAIGANAFAGIETLKKITIGESVKTIGEQAFYNCVNLETIFNYRPTPTNTYSNAFDGVDKFECELYVLPNSIDMYKAAAVWRDFYYTYAIGAEEATVTTNDVTVEPQDNAATLTWPTSNNAATYTIQITKDGVVFCTLIFNANGQLIGIAFAPSRDGQAHAPAALMTASGMQFTVTGLDSGTHYALTLQAKDSQENVLASYSSEFTTTGEGVATGLDNTPFPSGEGRGEALKLLRDGQIFILRGEKVYTLTGQEVK